MPGILTGLILIVDDLPTNLAVICETLSGVGLDVAIATSGKRALQQIARERPDLILLDLLMPGLDGFETCQRLKANPSTRDIPVIFMTALADTESKVTALALGAVDYVTKPFQEQEVLARVRTHLQLSRLTQTLEQAVHEATAALQASRVAEDVRKAAIAREQEKAATERVAELERVNDALKRSLDALATDSDLNQFVSHVLKTVAEQLDAPVVEYWSTSNNIAYLELTCWQGVVLNRKQLADYSHKQVVAVPPELAAHEALAQRQRHSIVDDLLNDPLHVRLYSALKCDLATWCNQHKVRRELNVPLRIGTSIIGTLCVYFPADRPFTNQQIELSYALAQQVTLSLRLTQLAEEAKQAAILEERNRMAREIHDTLAQSFTSIRMQLEAATRLLSSSPEQAQSCIAFAQELAKSGLVEARRSVWALQPEAEDYRHLSTTLERLAAQQTVETSIQVEVTIVGTPYALTPEVGMNLLRIGQEALNNALRHASAQTMLTLTYAPHQIQLQIQDDGQGFDPQQLNSGGFGLIGMQQRSDRLGGTFTISSQLGHGTEVKVTVPL